MLPEPEAEARLDALESTRTILIVEDEDDLLDLLVHRFERAGFEVVTATSGPEACDKIGRMRPDIILMDILLPQLTGLDVLEMLRKHPEPEVASTPVIIVTAQTTAEVMQKSFQLGANSFHYKPYSISDLVIRCCSLIKKHREENA